MNPACTVHRTITMYGIEISNLAFSQGIIQDQDIRSHPLYEACCRINTRISHSSKLNIYISDDSDIPWVYIGVFISQTGILPEEIEEEQHLHHSRSTTYTIKNSSITDNIDFSEYDSFLHELCEMVPSEHIRRRTPSRFEFEDKIDIQHINTSNSNNKIETILEYLRL